MRRIDCDGFAEQFRSHIVEQDHIRSGGQGFAQLRKPIHFGFDLNEMAAVSPGGPYGAGNPAGNGNMVILDQHRVVETVTMIGAATEADGVFFERAKPGDRLARAADPGPGMGDLIGERGRVGRDSRKMHEKVECHPLGGQNPPGHGRKFAQSSHLTPRDRHPRRPLRSG